jgi:hypothetical protein
MEKDSKRFAKSGGWGYSVFNYDPASDKFTADAKSPSDCGYACHAPVKAKDYIFHPTRRVEPERRLRQVAIWRSFVICWQLFLRVTLGLIVVDP